MKDNVVRRKCWCGGYERCNLCAPTSEQKKKIRRRVRKKIKNKLKKYIRNLLTKKSSCGKLKKYN